MKTVLKKEKMNINKITVFGAGIWGSVIAQHLAKNGYKVSLWEYNQQLLGVLKTIGRHPNIPNFKIHDNIALTGDVAEAVQDTDMIVFVISSKDSIFTPLFNEPRYEPEILGHGVSQKL